MTGTVEITESRDQWKARHKELCLFFRQKEDLEEQIQSLVRMKIQRERMRADEERERAKKLQAEIDIIWKKKWTNSTIYLQRLGE